MITIDHDTSPLEIECWLRRHGLPMLVRPRARRELLFSRAAPFLLSVLSIHLAGWMLAHTDITLTPPDAAATATFAARLCVVLALAVGVPIAAFTATARLLRRRARGLRAAGAAVTAYFLLVDPWIGGAPAAGVRLPVAAAMADALVVAGAVAATWAGIGSVAAWAARSSIRRLTALGEMSTRALPLLMLVVLFSFFAPAIWAVTNAMTAVRLLGVVAVFVLLVLLFILPVTRAELRGVDEGIDRGTDEAIDAGERAPAPPLSRVERANIQFVLIVAQGAQVAVFAALVAAFLIGLGQLALSPTVLTTWLGAEPAQVQLFGLRLGVDVALVKMSVFLSCVSALNFVVSATSNAAYKSAFYDPLFDEARVALAVRAVYRSALPQRPAQSPH